MDKEKTKVKNRRTVKRCNKLDGKTWLRYSISVWNDIRKSSEEAKLKHPAIFPAQLAGRLIEMLSKEGDYILDPFVGVGSTSIAAYERNRNSIGFDISPEYIKTAKTRVEQPKLFEQSDVKCKLILDNALNIINYINEKNIDLTVTSPPYWDILEQKRTVDSKDIRNYGSHHGDLSSLSDYNDFLKGLKIIFEKVYYVSKVGSYCCVIVMDIRKKKNFYPYHMDVSDFMREIGFTLDDTIIWDRRREYSNLRPLGYPSVFRVNKIHEYILIFQRTG